MRCWNVECRVTCWVMTCVMWRQFASRRIACQLSTCHISLIVMSHVTHWRTPWHTAPDHSDSWVTGVGAVSWYVIGWLSLLLIVKHEQLKTKGEACAHSRSLFKNFTVAAGRFICFVCLSVICIRWVLFEDCFFGGSVLRTEWCYRRPGLSWTKESLNNICKISWEGHLLWPDLSAVYASAGCGAFVCPDLAFFSVFFFPSAVIGWRYVLVWKAFCSIAPPFVRWWMVAAWLWYAPGGNAPQSLRTMLPKEGIDGVFVSVC